MHLAVGPLCTHYRDEAGERVPPRVCEKVLGMVSIVGEECPASFSLSGTSPDSACHRSNTSSPPPPPTASLEWEAGEECM